MRKQRIEPAARERIRWLSEANREFWNIHGVRFKDTFDIEPFARDFLDSGELGKTLDFCCGAGRHLLHLLGRRVDVSGFDFSQKSLDHARSEARKIDPRYPAEDRIRLGTMYEARQVFPRERFDTVFAYACVFENRFDGLVIALDQADQCLVDGGTLFVMIRTRIESDPAKIDVIEKTRDYTTLYHKYNGTTRIYFDPEPFTALVEELGYVRLKMSDEFSFGSRRNARARDLIFRKDVSKTNLQITGARE